MNCTFHGLADSRQWSAQCDRLVAAKVDLVRAVKQHAAMHLKVAVVDRRYVALGSFNWTNAAEYRNDEVLLTVTSPALAAMLVEQIDAARKANRL